MKNFIRLITLTIFLIALVAMLLFPSVSSKFELFRKDKEGHEKVGEIVFVPMGPGEYVSKIEAMFRTGNDERKEKISSLSFRLKYKGDLEKEFEVVPNKILLGSNEWIVPVNLVSKEEGIWSIDFAAVYTGFGGFVTDDYIPIATIRFERDSLMVDDLKKLNLDGEFTTMYTKTAPIENIIRTSGKIILGTR